MLRLRTLCLAIGFLGLIEPFATAQVAFVPTVSAFPNGVTLSVTPVASADRRYVRMSVNPFFTGLEGFDTVPVPAAVGGGGAGGGLGGAGGGFRSVAPGGGTFVAGMDGVVSHDQAAAYARGTSSPYNSADASALLAGGSPYTPRPQFQPGPGLNEPVRSKATRRSARTTRGKKTSQPKSP